MRVNVTTADIQENPTCPIQPALRRLTSHDWLVGITCAERTVEVEEDGDEDGDVVQKTVIIEMPEAVSDYIVAAANGQLVQPTEFEVTEPVILK